VSDGENRTDREGGLELRTVALGGSALSRAVQDGTVGAAWYAARPSTSAGWRSHAHAVRSDFAARDWLAPLSPALAATGIAAERLARAATSGVVVTTGQQPGLFGGPTYTWSKAMSALALADVLERETGVPVAPVFWAASDDADWMEAAVTHVASARGLQTITLPGPATEGVAMAEVPLGALRDARAALVAACGSSAHADILALVDAAYVPHATIGAAFVQLLRALLEPLGVAVLDAAHPALRAAADPLLRDALRHAPAIRDALRARATEIEGAGHAPQVDVVDELSLVFRTQLASRGGAVARVRERVPVAEAAAVAREADVGTLGANVLLRPVLERALLPTVCYLAGPGELAYFAQVPPVATALGAAVPVVAPRWACELVDADARALQARLGLDEADLCDPHAAEQRVARRQLDENVGDMLERLRVTLDAQVRALHEVLGGDRAPVADEVVNGLARDLGHRLDRFERRVLAGVKRRETEAMREVAVVRAAIRPKGQSPERVLNLVPFLVRYGPEVLVRMRDEAAGHAQRLVTGTATAP
jgi:bacillithiol biosynthesis cysteine-adding enzyme BshC